MDDERAIAALPAPLAPNTLQPTCAALTYDAQVTCAAGARTIPHAVSAMSANTYDYDCNGNQIIRTIGQDTFDLYYDAENRLVEVKKNGVTIAQFTYDGDGKRVKSVVDGETTLFVGSYYEQKGSQVTKYYFAGATRIAMRKYTIPQSMSVEYLLGDHLGSTSLTTDANGVKVSEMRYKPWGEVRYTWTASLSTTPAYKLPQYTFTGQFSYMDDPSTSGVTEGFGLMFYNARWYDPSLGRFTQADTIVPGGVQGLDRYAYVNNAPINYVDPTGHFTSKAIWSFLLDECDGNRQCASKLMNSWKNDLAWWDMITEAQAGDILFGTVSSPGWKPEGFALTFSGTGDSVLTGIEGDHTTNPVTLVDIQKGHREGCYAGGYPCFSLDYNWIGIVRGEKGRITFPYHKPHYEPVGFKPSDNLWATSLEYLVQYGLALVGTAACATTLIGIAACTAAGYAGGTMINDALDIQQNDYQYNIGPVYLNFQFNGDPNNPQWTLENIGP